MNSFRLYSLLVTVLVSFVSTVCAQTVKWVIEPEYIHITSFDDGIYKVKKGSKVGLIDENGSVIVPVTADSITNPVEGYSLILGFGEEKYRLNGVLGKDKKVIPITNAYYIDQYPFFSEGKLPVCDVKGKYGFMNTSGRLILDLEYATVYPFSEGLAAVSKKNLIGNVTALVKKSKGNLMYIDENGRPLTLQAEIRNIYSGTTFKNGEALVISKDEKQYIINTSGNIVRKDNNIALIFDEKYCLVSDNSKKEIPAAETVTYDGPTTFADNDLYGYRQDNAIILPAQFSEAVPFSKGYAIAGKDGKKGVLKLLKGSFSINQAKGSLAASDAQKEAVDYIVDIPEDWKKESLKLYYLDKEEDNNMSASLPGDGAEKRTFSFLLPTDRKDGQVMLEGKNLILWKNKIEDEKSLAAAAIEITVTPETIKANAKDNAFVSVRLNNHSEKSYEVSVKISGDRMKTVEKALRLQAGSVERISVGFNQVKKKEKRTVTIETSFADKISKEIWVIPFFTEY